jgi:hypothetical protein
LDTNAVSPNPVAIGELIEVLAPPPPPPPPHAASVSAETAPIADDADTLPRMLR